MRYLVAGILVDAVLSPGGGFYDLTVVQTGEKQRYLADVFESVAKPVEGKDESSSLV
jgi:hypothetical protein